MSKRSSMMSRVFFRRTAIKALVPDLKLVLVVLTVGCESHVGVYRPVGLGEDAGLDPASLAGALADLERRNHILPDTGTGEIFVVDFFRDNSFSTAARRGQARDDFGQIESQKLRKAVLQAIKNNPSCGLDIADCQQNQDAAFQGKGEGKGEAAAPRAHARGTVDAAAPISESKRLHPRRTQNGIECWYVCEDAPADVIEASTPPEQIAAAVAAIRARQNSAGKPTSPVPPLVKAELERQHRELNAAEQRTVTAQRVAAADTVDFDPIAAAKGEQLLAGIRRKSKTQNEVTTHE